MDADHLAQAISKSATRALAATDQDPATERVLKLYREDANSVAVAVLRALAGFEIGTANNIAPESFSRQKLSEIADRLAMAGSVGAPIRTATELS